MSRVERPIRAIDAVAAVLWTAALSLLLADAVAFSGHPGWLSRWALLLGQGALGATVVAATTWAVSELKTDRTAAELENLVQLHAREKQN